MNAATQRAAPAAPAIVRPISNEPVFVVLGDVQIAIRGATSVNGLDFDEDVAIPVPGEGLRAGCDYVVARAADGGPHIREAASLADCAAADVIGGFHFAPGHNAPSRAGGDNVPAINPCSVWDIGFRPACPDPRGMALVNGDRGPFWCDIYLLAADHLAGTSRFGVTIADGDDPPQKPDAAGERYDELDYEIAKTVLAHHGKGLLSIEEFFAAAIGVTEKTAIGSDPKVTGLDAPRTSRFGLMQATGNLLVWGHDGDPDEPRASIFGGYWWGDARAGSRYAHVGHWPGNSSGLLSARGRCDHLQPA